MRRIAMIPLSCWLACWACSGPAPVPDSVLGSPEAQAQGRALFLQHCALCHGTNADGRGARRSNLTGRPVNFTDPVWRRDVTSGQVRAVIRHGGEGTSMPAFGALREDDVNRLVAYLFSLTDD